MLMMILIKYFFLWEIFGGLDEFHHCKPTKMSKFATSFNLMYCFFIFSLSSLR